MLYTSLALKGSTCKTELKLSQVTAPKGKVLTKLSFFGTEPHHPLTDTILFQSMFKKLF